MKKGKMNLSELKVKSFVTEFQNEQENTVKGGYDPKYTNDDYECGGSNIMGIC